MSRYRYQIGVSGYWVECDAHEATVVYPDGFEREINDTIQRIGEDNATS